MHGPNEPLVLLQDQNLFLGASVAELWPVGSSKTGVGFAFLISFALKINKKGCVCYKIPRPQWPESDE